jgi:hypothetical protein
MRFVRRVAGVALVVALLPAAAHARPAEEANPFTTAASKRTDIHFVPLDTRARGLLLATVPAVKRYLAAPSEITAVPTSKASWVNQQRRQLNSVGIITELRTRFVRAQGDRGAFLVLVTSGSLYDPTFLAYRFVFGYHTVIGRQGIGIIGTTQMRVFHPEREKARLTKMMLRYIGASLCGLPRNNNPKSVMYQLILSDADLDRMVATLPSRCLAP